MITDKNISANSNKLSWLMALTIMLGLVASTGSHLVSRVCGKQPIPTEIRNSAVSQTARVLSFYTTPVTSSRHFVHTDNPVKTFQVVLIQYQQSVEVHYLNTSQQLISFLQPNKVTPYTPRNMADPIAPSARG